MKLVGGLFLDISFRKASQRSMALTSSGKTGGADDRAPISHGITFSFLCRFLRHGFGMRD
jgi:hypothetical protein